ncbi:MAG: hypothetical protein ACR2N8_03035 [Parvibaculales bacterium]
MNKISEAFKRVFVFDENETETHIAETENSALIYELVDDYIVIHSVIGDLEEVITLAENLGKEKCAPLYFLGRPGWSKVLEGRKGWETEVSCLGVYLADE